jgi:hypothetical protein
MRVAMQPCENEFGLVVSVTGASGSEHAQATTKPIVPKHQRDSSTLKYHECRHQVKQQPTCGSGTASCVAGVRQRQGSSSDWRAPQG